jgi:hypothetical protein
MRVNEYRVKCGFWQPRFIQDNFLLIGYHALRGFRSIGRGFILYVVEPPPSDLDLNFHIWQFRTEFIATESAPSCLLEMGINPHQISSLMQVIASYDPHQEIIMSMKIDQQIEIFSLQNLKVSPSECYKQVSNRWDEFAPDILNCY